MLPNTYETFVQDDAERFLVAIDKANSKEISNPSPHSDNHFNNYRKSSFNNEPIKSKIYNAFMKVPELLQWAVLLLGPDVPFTCTIRNFIDDLCNDVECMIIKNKGVDIHWSSMEDGVSTLPFLLTAITKQIIHQAEVNNLYSESVDKPQLVLCVIPDEGADEYIEEIKRICKKIKIAVVFMKCSEIALSTPEFRSSLGEEIKEKLIQFLIDQSKEPQNKRKSEDEYSKQPKTVNNKYYNMNNNGSGNSNFTQNNDYDFKNNNDNTSFSELSSPKYHYSNINTSYDNSSNSMPKTNHISPLNMGTNVSRSYQFNSPGRVERDRYHYSNHHDDNTLSPGWNLSKPIYFSKATNSSSQMNTSFSSRNNFSVSPSPHSSTSRRESTFSSMRNYSYFNSSQFYTGTSPINMDKKGYCNNNDASYSISNNSDMMYISELDPVTNSNKHSRSNTICNGVISNQKDVVTTPRKFSGAAYSKSFGNNYYNNNGNSFSGNNNKLNTRNKFINNNKRLSVNYNIGNNDRNNEYQYTNSYIEGLNLERNYNKNTSNWEGRNNYNNSKNIPMEYNSYSYHEGKNKNKYSKRSSPDNSFSNSPPTKNSSDIKSNKYDRKYDLEDENYNYNVIKEYSHNEEEILNKMDELEITNTNYDNNKEIPKYRPPIPPYTDKAENDEDIKSFNNNSYSHYNSKKGEDSLSRSLPTKNFFNETHNTKKFNENNDWNKNNKSNYRYNRYSNGCSYKSKSNDIYEENVLIDNVEYYNKKDKKDLSPTYNSTKSSPTHLSVDIKNLKYRAPTPKNIKEGKYKSISPDGYLSNKSHNYDNESSKNNSKRRSGILNDNDNLKDMETKINYSPKKKDKSIFINTNESNDNMTNNPKLTQSPPKVPSVEKYVPPNLRNQKYGNSLSPNSNPNSNQNSFDKSSPSLKLFIDKDLTSNINNPPSKIQSELTKEIRAQNELTKINSTLTVTPNLPINTKVIENKTNIITNNNSLLFNSRRHKLNPRTNINNNYNNDDYNNNVYTNPNTINKYYINAINPSCNSNYEYENSTNISENNTNNKNNNSDSLANYYRTHK
ncbi:hypothetical protein BCR32DRAFT_263900 [Anaeromyces robustus]|uniref:Uncharacterized protein n=1 Tax=Anaeromyces robustus TaxID=1754192 RepID=A0A1Y1XQM6_9FUNG|nr:hypothetical protein BCR32DRAFT_263900 [Anaeromyces robustus]|eukprot:ORX88033.1 hypothetical protein BCR32DRAFT_263900 [Anaeromyces robustus]